MSDQFDLYAMMQEDDRAIPDEFEPDEELLESGESDAD